MLGDFNINLLNYESHSDTNIFLNSMVSDCLLPYILHPTRVTDHSATVIDNIFSMLGDFNINLLNYESHSDTNMFLNSMVSKCLLPYILHPTRVTDHSATVIDNIFSMLGDFNINLLNYESHSDTNMFLNSMVSKCLLPYILHPQG